MNLLPFSIEAYEAGEEVVYRNGENPDEIFFIKSLNSAYRLISVMNGDLMWHSTDGGDKRILSTGSPFDLFIKPKTVEKYRNEYESGIVGRWRDDISSVNHVANINLTGGYDRTIAISKGTFIKEGLKEKLISIEIVKP